jgi:hypothetical protein
MIDRQLCFLPSTKFEFMSYELLGTGMDNGYAASATSQPFPAFYGTVGAWAALIGFLLSLNPFSFSGL